MMQWLRKRSLPARVLVYAAAVTLAFALAAGVGAMGALMLRGELNLPQTEEPQPPEEQKKAADEPQEKDVAKKEGSADRKDAAKQERATPQQNEAEYVSNVGNLQSDSVETFLESHDKILRYDALSADDIEQMRANEATLQGFADRADGLDPPQEYAEQYEVFTSAIKELHEGALLAYNLAADPTAATQSGFDEYDRHVNEANALLQRSNELLGRDYKTIEGEPRVNPLS